MVKITLLTVGKTAKPELATLIENYCTRLERYITFGFTVVPDIKNRKSLSPQKQKSLEGDKILTRLSPTDVVILLDEHGKTYRSRTFAKWLQNHLNAATRHIVFVVGGPYGFDQRILDRANGKISLSAMTFSHQMVRLFFVEQLYRAFTIIRGEPYHND